MTTKPDLNADAILMWLPEEPQPGSPTNGETRQFDSLTAALRFVKNELSKRQRATARIDSDGKSYEITEDGDLITEA